MQGLHVTSIDTSSQPHPTRAEIKEKEPNPRSSQSQGNSFSQGIHTLNVGNLWYKVDSHFESLMTQEGCMITVVLQQSLCWAGSWGAPGCWWLVTGSVGDASLCVSAAGHLVMGRVEGCPSTPSCHHSGCCGTLEGAEWMVINNGFENISSRFCRAIWVTWLNYFTWHFYRHSNSVSPFLLFPSSIWGN